MNAGISNCPICERSWLVTPLDDCLLPACGCFGWDTTSANPFRPCETCGHQHWANCSVAQRGAKEQAEAPTSAAWRQRNLRLNPEN